MDMRSFWMDQTTSRRFDKSVIDKYDDDDFPDPRTLYPGEASIQAVTEKESIVEIYDSKMDASYFKCASKEVIEVLRQAGTQFDPRIQSIFALYPCAVTNICSAWNGYKPIMTQETSSINGKEAVAARPQLAPPAAAQLL